MKSSTTRSWRASLLNDIERLPLQGSPAQWTPLRAHFGIEAFGVNGWSADAGEEVIGPHEESDAFAGGHEELFLVMSGHAAFTVGGEQVDAPAGTLVFVRDPGVTRGAVAHEDGTFVLAVGGRPGEPFEVAAWEFLVRAGARAHESDWDAAIDHTRKGLEAHPDSAELLYHRACYESLGGRPADAREHLDAAIALDPRNAERASTDPDLASLRA